MVMEVASELFAAGDIDGVTSFSSQAIPGTRQGKNEAERGLADTLGSAGPARGGA